MNYREEVTSYVDDNGWDSLLDDLYEFDTKAGVGVEGLLDSDREQGALAIVENLIDNYGFELEE